MFAKAHARMERWQEEMELLSEEMRRSLEYTRWKEEWWTTQASRRDTPGCHGYAMRQASNWRRFRKSLADLWIPALRQSNLESVIASFPAVQ
jgi:hypothetical protein